MDKTWLIYTGLTVIYIVILVVYFLRRSKNHEKELANFLKLAQEQLEHHKQQTALEANQKVAKAMAVVKKVQEASLAFETQAKNEYDQIIEDARTERREILAKAKAEVELLFKQAESEVETYKRNRFQEVEKSLVKLVMAVTEKVVGISLTSKDHHQLIDQSLAEVKQAKSQS